MDYSNLVKAVIWNADSGEGIKCLFNPNEYTSAKTNRWNREAASGKNVPQIEFGGGQPATLQMELLFDTFAYAKSGLGIGNAAKDVRKEYTEKIWKLMAVDERLRDDRTGMGRPPIVRFQWGLVWGFNAVITSISQKFTLFLHDGTPVRATLSVTFEQIEDERELPRQNPTSGGVGGTRVRTIVDGDTLGWIAHQEYGDPRLWRRIADANHLTQVRKLTPGAELVIPHA
jgi:nucleoid-associated protein YgaU